MALFVDLVALSNGLHGSVQMDLVALFSWIGWLRHHGIFNKVMNEYGVHANQPGTYIASDESGFNAFSILKCNLPKTKWFLKVIEKWFWFDDEDDIDWNDKGTDCIHFIQKYGV